MQQKKLIRLELVLGWVRALDAAAGYGWMDKLRSFMSVSRMW